MTLSGKRLLIAASIYLVTFFLARYIEGYEIPTHQQLSEVAATRSTLDGYLRYALTACFSYLGCQVSAHGFPNGIIQTLSDGKRPLDLITEGAANEDKPVLRSRQHFHNPRLAWDQAGWRPFVIQLGESSVLWSQDPSQIVGGKHSWKDARDSYFQALTATTQEDRDRFFAETFKSLGHLIHLVQDAANPAHTRNDTHIFRDDMHKWVESNAGDMIAGIGGTNADSLPLPAFDKSLLDQASGNQSAPVPIARIIDATVGDRGTLETGYNIGVAEYSNANFFSDDTVFSSAFPFPSAGDLESHPPEIDPETGETKTYLHFTGNSGGQTDYKVAHVSALKLITNEAVAPTDAFLDSAVMSDYARKLLPRAVSYSNGLIDYFFRNNMYGESGDVICYAPPFTTDPVYGPIGLWVSNYDFLTGLAGEQAGTGRIVVVVHYRSGGQDHYFTWADTTATLDPEQGAGWEMSRDPLGQVPADATELYFIIAYRGPLGQETDAVIGGVGYFWGLC